MLSGLPITWGTQGAGAAGRWPTAGVELVVGRGTGRNGELWAPPERLLRAPRAAQHRARR